MAGKLIKDDGGRFAYLVKDYLFGRAATVAYFGGFLVLFNTDKADQVKLEKLKQSPTFKADVEKLKAYAQNESLIDRYQKELMAYLSQLEVIDLGIGVHEGVDFDHLKPSDLEDKDIQKVVLAAIMSQEYEQKKGPMSFTGSSTGDYFTFDSIYSIAKIPKDILVNKMIDQVMCLNANNPVRGMTQAIGIQTINQILFADYYGVTYRVSKKVLINQ